MKKRTLLQFLLTSLILLSTSCGNDSDNDNLDNISKNSTLTSTRWSNNYWDYSIGNNYITVYEGGTDYIFYSDTEGLRYSWGREYDTDFGTTHGRTALHFTYTVSGEDVELTPISTKALSKIYLRIKNGRLYTSDNGELIKKDIDSSTNDWIRGLHGTTGTCKWYYDLNGNLLLSKVKYYPKCRDYAGYNILRINFTGDNIW